MCSTCRTCSEYVYICGHTKSVSMQHTIFNSVHVIAVVATNSYIHYNNNKTTILQTISRTTRTMSRHQQSKSKV